MAAQIVSKFRCTSITKHEGADGPEETKFTAASGEANKSWSQYTPAGMVAISITNPAAQGVFKPGAHYIVTFREAAEGE